MMAGLKRAYASFRGFDDETGSVPMMDGPLRPNARLDAAPVVLTLAEVDNLTVHRGALLCSSGATLIRIDPGVGATTEIGGYEAPISCVAAGPGESLAIGLDGIGLRVLEGPHAGRAVSEVGGRPLSCATAALFLDADRLVVTNGSQATTAAGWKRDLMQWGASGSVWLIDLSGGKATAAPLAQNLAFPSGVAMSGDGRLLVSEAWRHRILALDRQGGEPKPMLSDLPAYPGRIAPAGDGGHWLTLFAPRNQLVEFVLREDAYRRKMIETVPPDFWIAPKLSSGASFLEPIQGGARKKLNRLKPWSPSWSYGLAARCGVDMRPRESFHSRADGTVHGVTSACEFGDRLYLSARGSGRIVAIDRTNKGGGDGEPHP